MKYVLEPKTKNECEYCGMEVQAGDMAYETPEGLIHDECFYDYMRIFAKENGWRHYIYGEEEL